MDDTIHPDEDSAAQRATLRGLKDVAVVVEHLFAEPSQRQQEDPFRELLKQYIEAQLLEEGITVCREEPTPDTFLLYLNLSLFRTPFSVAETTEEVCLFNAVLQLRQSCYLRREPLIWALATTWSTGYVGIAARSDLNERLQDAIAHQISLFLQAYRSVNP